MLNYNNIYAYIDVLESKAFNLRSELNMHLNTMAYTKSSTTLSEEEVNGLVLVAQNELSTTLLGIIGEANLPESFTVPDGE